MSVYHIAETYEYQMLYRVEAKSIEEALELISDDPIEYRDYESEDPEHDLVKRVVEKG